MKLIFIRHGETRKNKTRKIHSKNDPDQLTEVGITQMKKVADKLNDFGVSVLYSSKEKRAIESAKVVESANNIKNIPIDGLQERNWGVFSGKSWGEVEEVLNPMSLEERYNYVPKNGESWKVFESRLIKAVTNIVNTQKGKNIAITTHGGAVRALMPYLLNASKDESFKYDLDNASLTVFDFDGHKYVTIVINDTSHLSSK